MVTRRHLNVTAIRTLAAVLFFSKSFLTYYESPWNLPSWRAWGVADSMKASEDASFGLFFGTLRFEPTTKNFGERIFLYIYIYIYTFMWPCIVTNFFLIKPTDALISHIYFATKIYMFRAVPLPIIRSFPLYILHCYMSCGFDDIYQCRMYSWTLLMMGRGTARNM